MSIPQFERQALDAMAAGNLALAERYADQADALDRATPPPTLPAVAAWYASLGLHIFPLQPGTKIPYPRSRGCRDATNNPTTINNWWAKAPDSNIGIATGHLVDVIDIDGPQGIKTWINDLWGNLPPVIGEVSTPRPGGLHLYITSIDGVGNRTHMLPGIDYRGRGGYVVAPPSTIDHRQDTHSPGSAHGTYRWTTPLGATA